MNTIVAIDPSTNYCGYAVYSSNNGKTCLKDKGLIKPDRKLDNPHEKALSVYQQVRNIIAKLNSNSSIVVVVIEIPRYWSFSDRGVVGDIYLLSYLCGMLATLSEQVYLVQPQEWKAQYPKPVVRNRLVRMFSKMAPKLSEELKTINHNTLDAVGIGFWFLFRKKYGKTV